ncbi:uncharacterized protein NPIL_651601 [Nephila pilipes]|uniref:Uncharacterized protein n=1 Tax=Nephila pilipes TaxID=299642 RepID=A0A8X6JB57_NEPPI|nr:uncharacterized protein NPIL_651601 [Nephila pilipes]
MDSSRPKVSKSKIPVKVPMKSRTQLSVQISEREAIENEENEKSHAVSTIIKKRTYPYKVQQTVNLNNKYNSKAAKSNSTDVCRRSGIKSELKQPSVPIKRNENKQLSSTTFRTKIHYSSKTSDKEINKQSDLPVRNAVKREAKQKSSNLIKKKVIHSNLQNNFPKTGSEEQSKDSNHISQQDITFVADERFRHLILSGKELTPSTLKSCCDTKQSFMNERPSLYKRFEAPVNPYQEILKAIENRDLVVEDRRISTLRKIYPSPLRNERPSLYKKFENPVNPYQELYKVIENRDLAAGDCRFSTLKKVYPSPVKERNSLHKQYMHVNNPYQEALNSLAELRIKQNLKDKKKVTFNLPGDPLSATVSEDENMTENVKSRLTDISETCDGNNSSSTPEFPEGIILSKPNDISSIEVTPSSSSISKSDDVNRKIFENCPESIEEKSDFCTDLQSIPTPPSSYSQIVPNIKDNISLKSDTSLFEGKVYKNFRGLNTFGSEARRSFYKPSNLVFNSLRISELRSSLYFARSEQPRQKTFSKLCTPKPISFNPKTKLTENISPEFLSRRTSNILSHAPINTPLVLKSLANSDLENYESSPICKKLDFIDSPKTNHKEDEHSRKGEDSKENTQTFCLQNILTQQKILDQLAHQECHFLMQETTFPSNNRIHLLNPVARILLEGDEMVRMHFF